MDLKGAEIRNILNLCKEMNSVDNKPLRVNIPHYQRPYKWDESQIRNLVSDFYKNINEGIDDAEYFVGSVVLVKNERLEEDRQDVIDGQQRITTVFLLNYLRFLLLRAHIEDLIIQKAPGAIAERITELKDCYTKLLGSNGKAKYFDAMKIFIVETIDELDESGKGSAPEDWERILKRYQQTVALPPRDFSNIDSYHEVYSQKLNEFLSGEELALKYSRTSYNDKLKTALSMAMIQSTVDIRPKLTLLKNEDDPILQQYLSAMEFAFQALCEQIPEKVTSANKTAKFLIEEIDCMMESLKFCVIMTGSERDAYTLFEVLNDRSMKVDDLDLIKNLFLKEYCDKSKENDIAIDATVGYIDSLWGEEIFDPSSVSEARAKRISYLATIYLTADENVYANKAEKFRETIDKSYFGVFYENEKYTSLQIKKDIAIFQMVSVLFDTYQIPANKKFATAIKAENESGTSITYKTLHLLNALDQDGVIAALTNLIIGSYVQSSSSFGANGLDVKDFRKFITELKEDKEHNSPKFETIHRWAFELWKAALLAKDYQIPREIARKMISLVSIARFEIDSMFITPRQTSELKNEFISWTSSWQYSTPKLDFRIRVLFIELFHTSKTDSIISYGATTIALTTDKVNLDHLDARKPDDTWAACYYYPEDPNKLREREVNGLGNFMILDQENNNDKANKPLDKALGFYDKFRSKGVWLIDEIVSTLNQKECHRDVKFGDDTIKVPNDRFFTTRAKSLQEYFFTILSRTSITDTELTIQRLNSKE